MNQCNSCIHMDDCFERLFKTGTVSFGGSPNEADLREGCRMKSEKKTKIDRQGIGYCGRIVLYKCVWVGVCVGVCAHS